MNANERFEVIGKLYQLRTGYLRPGKDSVHYDSSSDENHVRFEDWFATKGFSDAIERIHILECEVERLERENEELKR